MSIWIDIQWGGGNDIYAANTLLPDIGEGGLWSIKSLTAEDKLGNISIYEKADFSDSAISSLSSGLISSRW